MCMGLIFYALAGGGGPLELERVLFGTGLLLVLIGIGILFLYLIFELAGTRRKE